MASQTSAPPSDAVRPAATNPSRYDEYIDGQLRKAQGHVRFVEVAEALMTMAAATLAFLLVFTVLDHWVVHGGLGFWGRTAAFAALLLGLVAYAVKNLLPHVVHSVNPAFAAHALESAEPSLKNTLVNFLFLRGDHRGVPEVVFQGLSQQAATGLSHVATDSAADRSRVVKVGYALIAIVLVCAVYKVLSPKDLFPSVARAMVPWADIAPVTRVRIQEIEPGDTEAVMFTQLKVSAEVRGLREDEAVTLYYSSDDKQAVNVPITMYRSEGERLHSCLVPDSEGGLAHDLIYRIEAGDAVTRPYEVKVVAAPTFHVNSLEYQYPAYTGLQSRKIADVGDIKAIEGTEVVLRSASQEIGSASIELQGLRDGTLPMKWEGNAAYHRLVLQRKTVGRQSLPQWTSYRLRMTTPGGTSNTNPIRHRIEVVQDKPPVVEILKPEEPVIEVPADADVAIELRARDPDFRLSAVRLLADRDDESLCDENLLPTGTGDAPLEGAFRTSYRFVPARYKLKAGDTVCYRAVAEDNKQPEAGRTETSEYRIIITEPEGRPQEQSDGEQPSDPDQSPDPDSEKGPDDGEQRDGQADSAGQSDEGETSKSDEGGQGAGDQSQPSEDSEDGSEAGNGQGSEAGSEQQPADQQDGDQQDGDQQDGDQQDGDQQDGEGAKGGQPGDDSQPRDGEQPMGDQTSQNSDGQGQRGQQQDPSGGTDSQSGSQSGSQGAEDSADQPVDNDGDAFEKALEHLREKGQDPTSDSAAEGDSTQPGDEGMSRDPAADPSAGESTDGGSDRGGQDGSGPQADGQTTEEGPSPREGQDNQAGEGQEPKDDGQGADQESPAGSRKSQSESGGGRGGEGQTPPPPPEGQGQPRDKSGSPSKDNQGQDEPGDSSVSQRESDSAEGEQGTRSGKGDEGGGQRSPQQGEGAEGSNTPSDSGGNTSQESGKGDSSNRPGDDTPTDQATGQQGDQEGDASQSSRGKPGDSEGQSRSSDEQGGEPSDQDGPPTAEPGQEGKGKPGDAAQGAGRPGDATADGVPQGGGGTQQGRPDQGERGEPGADEANLDYARKQTEMVLEYLQNQLDKGGVDAELKKKFGWTDEQFREFVRRHSRLRQEAQASGDEGREAQAELDETLRSLGLRPTTGRVRTEQQREVKAPGLSESSRSRPPREYQEQFDAFRKDAFDR